MRYFIISGEASGDRHASMLMSSIKKSDHDAEFVGMGGAMMYSAGCRLVQTIDKMAYMGVVAVVRNINNVRRNFRIAQSELITFRPHVVILVDYPSFNLKIAKYCKKHLPDTKIVYYIPPKVWAWKTWRIHTINKLCDKVLTIFPFEKDFYSRFGYTAHYVGNPTKEEIDLYRPSKIQKENIIALLPGSRKSEIENCLPRMLKAARKFPDYKIVVAASLNIDPKVYNRYLLRNEQLICGRTYEVVARAKAAIVNSGTATLETALIGTPQVAVYYIAYSTPLLVKIFKPILFKIPYFTLVNLIASKEVIKELVADRFTVENMIAVLEKLLYEKEYVATIEREYKSINTILGDKSASECAAREILTLFE